MRKFVKRIGIAAALASAVSVASLIGGCDDQRASDKQVLKNVNDARVKRYQGDQAGAEALLQQAAQASDASPAAQAHAKSLLAQAEVENAIHLINDREEGVEAGNSEIARLLYEIGALGQQIQTSNALVNGYKLYEPGPAQAMAQEQMAAAKGGPDKPTWFGEQKSGLPSLAAVTQEVSRIQAEIAKLQAQIKTLNAQQTQLGQQAEQATRAAAVAQGRAGVDAEKRAAELRKKTADIANQIDVLEAKLVPLQTDLSVAQARQAALTSAIDQFQKLSENFMSGWKGIEQQVVRQQQLATAVYQGVGGATTKASTNSITSKAIELDKVGGRTQEAFSKAEENLTGAISHFDQAANAAQQLQQVLSAQLSEPGVRGTERGKTIEAAQQAFNPNTFKLGQADAQQLLATLYTSRISALTSRQRVARNLEPILKGAGLTMPTQLADPKLTATITELAKKAEEIYNAVAENYLQIAESSQTESQKTAGHIGRMFAAYGHAQLARALDNPKAADQHLALAREARDLVIQEKGPAAIPAYPSELVPSGAATRPATAPASAPATAPAAPGETTAPAEGTTPAPAEGATPPAPAEGTTPAPAEGAKPPAEGATPAPR